MNAIEIRNLTKNFGEKTVVNGLTLDIRRGELFSLLGVNGAGKTTAIRMLCGILLPDGGDAVLMGKSVVREADKVKAICGLSPQETALAPRLSVYENLEMAARIHGSNKAEARRRTEEIIARNGFSGLEKQRAGRLSGGWQRRLSIAMALIPEPEILFLDEPTLGLDVLARHELWNMLRSLHGKTTIMLTTHYLEEAEALSDRIGIMRGGCICAAGTPEELTALSGGKNFEDAFVKLAAGGEN